MISIGEKSEKPDYKTGFGLNLFIGTDKNGRKDVTAITGSSGNISGDVVINNLDDEEKKKVLDLYFNGKPLVDTFVTAPKPEEGDMIPSSLKSKNYK